MLFHCFAGVTRESTGAEGGGVSSASVDFVAVVSHGANVGRSEKRGCQLFNTF